MSLRANTFDTRGMSGAEIRNKVRNDPTLNALYGWLFDGVGNGGLIAVRAINAAYRAESIGDRQACNQQGGFYAVRGQQCIQGSDAYDYIQSINEASPAYDRSRTWLENNADNIDDNGWITGDPEKTFEANTAQGLYDELKDKITGCVGSPLDCVKQIGTAILESGGIPDYCTDGTMNDPFFCTEKGPNEGGKACWKDCVSFNLPGLPIPDIPLPPGVVDVGTYRDFENAVKTVGTTIGDIIDGNESCGR
jgi:hypothetical protein